MKQVRIKDFFVKNTRIGTQHPLIQYSPKSTVPSKQATIKDFFVQNTRNETQHPPKSTVLSNDAISNTSINTSISISQVKSLSNGKSKVPSIDSPNSTTVSILNERNDNEIRQFLHLSQIKFNQLFRREDEDLQIAHQFNERIKQSLQSTIKCYHTEQWKEFLALRSIDEWCDVISNFTLPATKKMLNKSEIPTMEDIINCRWIDTTQAGVYFHLFQPVIQDGTHHTHLYIGEASGDKGLAGRRLRHQQELDKSKDKKRNPSYHYNVFRTTPRVSTWGILFLVPDLEVKDGIEENEQE